MLSNAYFLAKFRFDTAENEPAKNLQNFRKCIFRKMHFSKMHFSKNSETPGHKYRSVDAHEPLVCLDLCVGLVVLGLLDSLLDDFCLLQGVVEPARRLRSQLLRRSFIACLSQKSISFRPKYSDI